MREFETDDVRKTFDVPLESASAGLIWNLHALLYAENKPMDPRLSWMLGFMAAQVDQLEWKINYQRRRIESGFLLMTLDEMSEVSGRSTTTMRRQIASLVALGYVERARTRMLKIVEGKRMHRMMNAYLIKLPIACAGSFNLQYRVRFASEITVDGLRIVNA